MPTYEAVIFDLDGTLLNTLQDLTDSTNYTLALHGLPTRTLEEVRGFVGNGIPKLIARSVPENTSPELEAQCLADFRAHYTLNMENTTAPYAGILPMLDALNENGIKCAVVSNKFDGAVKGLCQTFFDNRIAVAIGSSKSLGRKPAPGMVFRTMEEMSVDPAHAVYVGDSDVDIATAQNAGLPCISVSWGFRDRDFLLEHGASTVVATPEELLALLLK